LATLLERGVGRNERSAISIDEAGNAFEPSALTILQTYDLVEEVARFVGQTKKPRDCDPWALCEIHRM